MSVIPDMVGIVVAEMGRSLAFYRLLGLDIASGQDDEPYVDVTTPNGYRISWNTEATIKSFDAEWQPPTGGPRVSLAFKCDSVAEVDATFATLLASGLGVSHKEPWDAAWGYRYAILLDPDGNSIDLFAPLESPEGSKSSGG